jgi:hypothetical protein
MGVGVANVDATVQFNDNCHELVKSKDINDLNKTSLDQTSRKRLIDEAFLRLSHIYCIDDALRCVILERPSRCVAALIRNLGGGRFSGSVGRTTVVRKKKRIVSRGTGSGMRSSAKNKFALTTKNQPTPFSESCVMALTA